MPGDLWPRMLGGAAERLDVLVYGIYTNPHHVIEYTSNGEVRQEFSIVFTARPISGTPATSSESSEVVWVPTAEVAQLTMHPTMRQRISHYLEQRPDPYIA